MIGRGMGDGDGGEDSVVKVEVSALLLSKVGLSLRLIFDLIVERKVVPQAFYRGVSCLMSTHMG
jgi:hypothetical protein